VSNDLVTQIRQALEDRAARIKHHDGCGLRLYNGLCTCGRENVMQADAARAIAAALTKGTEATYRMCALVGEYPAASTYRAADTAFVTALRQEAP